MWKSLRETRRPVASRMRLRAFFPAESEAGSPWAGAPGATWARDMYIEAMPLGLKKSSGATYEERKTSSLKYRKCSLSPSIRCRFASIAWELKLAAGVPAGAMSVWSITVRRGWSSRSHAGR